MTFNICDKRSQILDASSHVLVAGGPGSGKTTIALLKAQRTIDSGLCNGQSVLFLSFSRAAVARIAEATQSLIPKKQRKQLNIQTFHSFFWEVLRVHGYLLGAPKNLKIFLPHDEKARSGGIERNDPSWTDWECQRDKLFYEEGHVAFDLFAPKTAELMRRCVRIRNLITEKHPLIIVDEAQDTGPDQWECIRLLAESSQILCLADLDQQIFDFLPGIGPERIKQIEDDLHPVRLDFGCENNRSPESEIADFGYDILVNVSRRKPYKGVSMATFHPSAVNRDRAIRQSVGRIIRTVELESGQRPESIAILASFDRGVVMISNALLSGARPIRHKVSFNETETLLAGRFIAFLMEPKTYGNKVSDLALALELLSLVFRAKGSRHSLKFSQKIDTWTHKTLAGQVPTTAKLYRALSNLFNELPGIVHTGDPVKDWNYLREKLRKADVQELSMIDKALQFLLLYNRGKRIASSLISVWEKHGNYCDARKALDEAIAEDQLYSGLEDLLGIHVMTMHKAKGKQFDAVIIIREQYCSPFVWPGDDEPYGKSRKVLRVAITRARLHTMILNQQFPACPILKPHRL